MKKRLLSLLLCAALLCLSAGAMAEPVKINIFGLSVTVPESDPVLPELEKRLGIEISVEFTGGDESSLAARLFGGNVCVPRQQHQQPQELLRIRRAAQPGPLHGQNAQPQGHLYRSGMGPRKL